MEKMHHCAHTGMQYPFTAAENLHMAHTKLKAWNLVATPWDKKLHKLGGFCTVLCETHVRDGILSAKEFDSVGVSPSDWQCQAMALSLILQFAHRHRILNLGEDLYVLHSALQDPQHKTMYISKHCIPETLWDVLPFPAPLCPANHLFITKMEVTGDDQLLSLEKHHFFCKP